MSLCSQSGGQLERYDSVTGTCKRFRISRSTFYRMLADRHSGLSKILIRIPPITGRIRVPQSAFEEWLLKGRK